MTPHPRTDAGFLGTGLLGRLLVGLIRAYQLLISPFMPASCRYYPSCSAYGAEAITRHGALAGLWLALRRILRCHPWGGMGIDPVPECPPFAGLLEDRKSGWLERFRHSSSRFQPAPPRGHPPGHPRHTMALGGREGERAGAEGFENPAGAALSWEHPE